MAVRFPEMPKEEIQNYKDVAEYLDMKRLLRMQTPVFGFQTITQCSVVKKEALVSCDSEFHVAIISHI